MVTTNSLGRRALERYALGQIDRATLDAYYAKGWISDEDYTAATEPPAGT